MEDGNEMRFRLLLSIIYGNRRDINLSISARKWFTSSIVRKGRIAQAAGLRSMLSHNGFQPPVNSKSVGPCCNHYTMYTKIDSNLNIIYSSALERAIRNEL